MNAARLIGHVLLWIGFLGGAFVAVRSTEVDDNPWTTISWPAYGVAIAVAVAGVVQLRLTKNRLREATEDHAANVDELAAVLGRVRKRLAEWQTDDNQLDVYAVHHRIEEHLADDLATFADRRESLIDAFGLEHYANIMTEFALAERTINRMWSASADGYIDEVNACLTRAIEHLDAATSLLKTARAAHSAA
jgi:hypothetical protein